MKVKQFGKEAALLVPTILAQYDDASQLSRYAKETHQAEDTVREMIIGAIVAIDPEGRQATETFTRHALQGDLLVVEGLIQMNTINEEVIAYVVQQVGKKREAASLVGGIGPRAVAAAPVLAKLLADEEMRFLAGSSLGKLGKGAVPHLIPMLSARNWMVSSAAAEALAEIGPDAAESVPALTQALHVGPRSYLTILSAIKALVAIGPPSASAIPDLIFIRDKFYVPTNIPSFAGISWDVKMAARDAIKKITAAMNQGSNRGPYDTFPVIASNAAVQTPFFTSS